MGRHLFDTVGRISAEEVSEYPLSLWQPPEIDASGHLVQVQPRPEALKRDQVQEPDGGSEAAARATTELSESEREAETARAREDGYRKGYEEGLEQGRQEGRQTGVEEGRREALEEGRRELQPRLAELNRLATSLTHALNEQDYHLEQALLNLVKEVARQVIQRELVLDNSALMPVIRQALRTLPPGPDNVRILVHPDDLPLLQQAIDEGGENWSAVARNDVTRGGCRIETDHSVLDFTLEHRFRTVIEQVVQRRLADPAVEQEPLEEAPEPLVPESTDTSTGSTA
ncbi:MAG: flagellar assembly protein FliH [Pseudomonadota bacterium]